jgi:hypothetical protein
MAISCLYTSIKNVSGASYNANWLQRGKVLAAGDCLTLFGDISDYAFDDRGRINQRFVTALNNALTNNQLEIISSPAPILFDATLTKVKYLKLDNNVLTTTDPCYGSYTGAGC